MAQVESLQSRKPVQELLEPTLPLEILENIFVLACEEHGTVARSLSVVCKTTHSIVKYAARFDTVTLRSGTEREVRRCLSLLNEACAASTTRSDRVARPTIRHLCILISPAELWSLMHMYDSLRPWNTRNHAFVAPYALRNGLEDAVQTLLLQVSPDLESLCVLRVPGDRHSLLPQGGITFRYRRGFRGFPKLRDLLFTASLSFKPSHSYSGTDDDAGDQIPNGPLFPALKRIHLAPCCRLGTDIIFDWWKNEAPALESLWVTLSYRRREDEVDYPSLPLDVARVGLAKVKELSSLRSTSIAGPTGAVGDVTFRFRCLKEAVVVITCCPDKDDIKGLARGLAQRMIRWLSAPKTKPASLSDLFPIVASEQYLDRDWRQRVAEPTGDGINLFEFSQAFGCNVTVYRTKLEGPH